MNTNNGRLPVIVRGPLQPGEFRMDGSLSSQYLTGMLLALPRLSGRSTVVAERLTSIPYVEMTIQVASLFGVSVQTADWKHFEVPGNQPYQAVDVAVPGDWSAAAFLLVAGALASDQGVLITNLDTAITQADARILHFLSEAGVRWEQRDHGIFVVRSHVQAFDADLTHCPDLFPPLVVLAAHANGVCTFKGARRLVSKESNRARVLQEEWAKANIRILVRDDEMKVYPGFARRAVIHSHQDHRIAMAAAVMGLAGERTSVVSAECVSKSFPSFFDALRSIRAKVILQ